jgi:RsmE family RNA methyltransferase
VQRRAQGPVAWDYRVVNVILLEAAEIDAGGTARVGGERARHIATVLRPAPGAEIRVGVVDGAPGRATILHAAPDLVEMRCTFEARQPPRPRVDVLLALPRPKVLRRLWAQLAALGVGRIILTNAEKVERNYFDTHVLTPDCYRPLLIEGLQQARDTRLPVVSIHRQFKVLVEDQLDALVTNDQRLVAHPGDFPPVSEAVRTATAARVLLAIGPEGGWNDFERALLERRGFRPVAMGQRTLRSDTAAIALIALAHDGFARRDSRYS